jgi:hypothetical protein
VSDPDALLPDQPLADPLLAALWAADEPPAADAQFVVAVMARAARRRFQLELLGMLPVAIAAGAILWALSPWLDVVLDRATLAIATPAVAATAAALAMAFWLWTCVEGRHRPLELLGIDDAP